MLFNLFKIKINFNCSLCFLIYKSVSEKIHFINIKVKVYLKMNSNRLLHDFFSWSSNIDNFFLLKKLLKLYFNYINEYNPGISFSKIPIFFNLENFWGIFSKIWLDLKKSFRHFQILTYLLTVANTIYIIKENFYF